MIPALIITSCIILVGLVIIWEPESLLMKRFKKHPVSQRVSLLGRLSLFLTDKLTPSTSETKNNNNNVKILLMQAGRAFSKEDVAKFNARCIADMIIAVGILSVFGVCAILNDFDSTSVVLIVAIGAYYAYKRPYFVLKKEIKLRDKEFMKFLPDALDLLAICVQAGVGLDAAFVRVAEEFAVTSKVVSSEFERLNSDINQNLNREEAYKNLALRNPNPDLQSFIALLIQTDKLGTSISQSLEAFCDTLRTKKRQRIEELAQKASSKMTIPMVCFLLPAIFIFILYPAIQKISQNMN